MSIWSKIGSFVAGPFGAIAATAVSSLLGAKAAREQRKQTISDQDNQFVRMRNAATKAGFNPLTVLRSGGGQMFGGVPTFSKAGFMQQFVQQGYNAWATHPENDPLKKHYDEIRRLEKEQRQVTLAIDKLQLANLKKPSVNNQLVGSSIKSGANATEIKVTNTGSITKETLVPGTGKTLDEIFEEQPVDNRVVKTGDGSYTNDIMSAALYPLVTPGGNVIYVPWNPEDADVGAIAGGAAQYGGLKIYDKIKGFSWDSLLNAIDPMSQTELDLRIQLDRLR